jgi:hypothetical protein
MKIRKEIRRKKNEHRGKLGCRHPAFDNLPSCQNNDGFI